MQQTAPRTTRPRSRRGHGDQLRAEIIAAVNRLLDSWGSDEKLTMRAVAQEVGVAAPSIYLHFPDKSALVWAALADKYAQLAESMQVRAADSNTDPAIEEGPRGRLRAQVHAYCRFAIDNPGHYRLMYQIRQPAMEPEQVGQHPARQVSGLLRSTLRECAEAGHALSLPLYQCAHTLWTGLHGMVSIQHTMAVSGAVDDTAALADGLVDLLVDRETTSGATYPPQTAVDRLIAGSIADQPQGKPRNER